MQRILSLVSLALALTEPVALGLPRDYSGSRIVRRAQDLKKSYDYVIIGGGTAGLTVADRLTEDADTTVLVIEHGDLGKIRPVLSNPAVRLGMTNN